MAQIRLKQNLTAGQTIDVPDAAVQPLVDAGIAERTDGTQTGQPTPQPASGSPAAGQGSPAKPAQR